MKINPKTILFIIIIYMFITSFMYCESNNNQAINYKEEEIHKDVGNIMLDSEIPESKLENLIAESSIIKNEVTDIVEDDELEKFVKFVKPKSNRPDETKDIINDETNVGINTKANTENGDSNLVSLGEFKLTAYCSCSKCCGEYALNRPVDENGEEIVYGALGERLVAGISIAVDPNVIPYWSEVVINGHTYIAHDTGGAIKENRIDVYFDNHQDALSFGVRYAEVFIVT